MLCRTIHRAVGRSSSLKSVPLRAFAAEGSKESKGTYTERMSLKGRPVSPHVTIYALPVAAVSSILNRVTGMALSVGVFGIASASLIGMDVVPIVNSIGNSYVGPVAKLAVAFPLVYHYLAGIRHLMWDRSPPMLESKLVTQSSYILLGASGAISLGLAFVKI